MGSDRTQRRGNDWRTQPRDRTSGQFMARAHMFAPRSEIIRIRVTSAERELIEHAAEALDMSMTAFLVHAARRMAPAERVAESVVQRHKKALARRRR